MNFWAPTPRVSVPVDLGWDPTMCISNKFTVGTMLLSWWPPCENHCSRFFPTMMRSANSDHDLYYESSQSTWKRKDTLPAQVNHTLPSNHFDWVNRWYILYNISTLTSFPDCSTKFWLNSITDFPGLPPQVIVWLDEAQFSFPHPLHNHSGRGWSSSVRPSISISNGTVASQQLLPYILTWIFASLKLKTSLPFQLDHLSTTSSDIEDFGSHSSSPLKYGSPSRRLQCLGIMVASHLHQLSQFQRDFSLLYLRDSFPKQNSEPCHPWNYKIMHSILSQSSVF